MKTTLIALAFASALTSAAQAQDMVFTSWGGTTQDAQAAHWAAPFTEKGGPAVVQDGPTDAVPRSGVAGADRHR